MFEISLAFLQALKSTKLNEWCLMNSEAVISNENKSSENLAGKYTVTISPHINEKLDNHVLIMKKLIDRGVTKHLWIINAIEEKLAHDANQQQVPKVPHLNIRIDEELDKKILERIEFIRKFRKSYSKKQWLIDAILEKLDRDDSKIGKFKQQPQGDMHEELEKLQAIITGLKTHVLKNK